MATLKDVAREAGLSVGTVSRVLNNRGYISDETRQSVYSAMKQLHYQPNEMARSLSRKRSNMIGVIVPNISHPYFSKLLSFLEEAAHREGYEILLFASHGEAETEEEYVRACSRNRVAGLILCIGSVRTGKLRDLGFPVVVCERFLNEADAGVECDNYGGGALAAEELIRAGCRNLVCICGGTDVSMPADGRREGFMDTCRKYENIQVKSFLCSPERLLDLNYAPEIHAFLDEVPGADGIFANSDVIAAIAMGVLRERGRKVPEDVKVIGYDDVIVAETTNPPLTTIRQPVREMADACIDIVKKASLGQSIPTRETFRVSLIRRGTV